MERTIKTKFYTFSQNNSGGGWIKDNNLDQEVIIEAQNLDEAINKAMNLGIYFNGVEKGLDCDCCGDRWYEPYLEEGTDEPKIDSYPPEGTWLIHYYDGKVERR